MDTTLNKVKTDVYDPCGLYISDFLLEPESKAYNASCFKLNKLSVVYRNAKITPKKEGLFVTFWKRDEKKPIRPFEETDFFDFFVVTVLGKNQWGQFVFPKSILIKKGIVSTHHKEGKRAFRIYPTWSNPKSKLALQTQRWQREYFYEIDETTNLKRVNQLYNTTFNF